MNKTYDVCVVGGAGHVGLPLGISFANAGLKTVLLDINTALLSKIREGKFPFKEEHGAEALGEALAKGTLFMSDAPDVIAESEYVIIVVGTPVDKYLSPKLGVIMDTLEEYVDYFRDGQTVILRSTVYPGTTEKVKDYFIDKGKRVSVAYCPERVAQGHAIDEIKKLPQIVSAFDDETFRKVSALFKRIVSAGIVSVKPLEAELVKLFTNSWRYIRFAAANQFYMVAEELGLNYHDIYNAMVREYPRNRDLPSPGFAAGPCLLKDTMQLTAFTNNAFVIGHASILINEGLANFIMTRLKRTHGNTLKEKTIGILGMAFKADIDDPRDSISYKLRDIAQSEGKRVLCSDSYIDDPEFVPAETLLRDSHIVVLASPHAEYAHIKPEEHPHIHFVDIWNFWGKA